MTPRPPSAVTVYLGLLALGAAGALALSIHRWGAPDQVAWLVPLFVLALLARAVPDVTVRHIDILLHSIVLLAAIPLVGPTGAIIVHAAPTAWRYRDRLSRVVFNTATPITGLVAGTLAAELLTRDGIGHEAPPAELGLDLAVITLVIAVWNALTLAIVIRLTEGTPVSSMLRLLARQMAVAYLGYAIAAYLLVLLWAPAGIGWFSAVLLMPSLLVAQWSLLQYPRERRIYDAMLDALVEALEVRSPGSRRHSELASRVATGIAEDLRLSVRDVETIGAAARLHDVGLLAMPQDLLRGSVGPRGQELRALVDHPGDSARILGGVSFLRASMPAVLAHHERYDGSGYPQGLVGESIPLGARVVAVADAWTSLVLPRTARPSLTAEQALTRCEELAGSALDPGCVAALRHVLERQPTLLEVPDGAVRAREVGEGSSWRTVDQAHPAMTSWVARHARGESW